MTDREKAEQQIRETLANESQAIPLSNKLFSPDGLFSRLADTEEERRVLVQSPLFRQAQRRFRELQRTEAREFTRAMEQFQAAVPQGEHLLKSGHAEIT